jgi:hypothetical protein
MIVSEELKAIEALASALGFDLIKKTDRYPVSNQLAGQPGVHTEVGTGECYRIRTWFECNPSIGE